MTRSVLLGLLALVPAGCGTMSNLGVPSGPFAHGDPNLEIYGGVANTVAMMKLAHIDGDGRLPKLEAAALALDVAASAVADTITLPLTASAAAARAIHAYYFREPPDPEEMRKWRENLRNQPPGELTPERIHGGII